MLITKALLELHLTYRAKIDALNSTIKLVNESGGDASTLQKELSRLKEKWAATADDISSFGPDAEKQLESMQKLYGDKN